MLLSPALVFSGRWSPYGAALILGLWGARWHATGRLWVRTPLDPPLALLLAATLVAYSVSPLPALSASKLWGILVGLAAYVSVVNWVESGARARIVGWALAALGAGIAALALVGTDWEAAQLVGLPWLYDHLPRVVRGIPGSGLPSASEFFNPREVGGTLALLLPLPLAVALLVEHPRRALLILAATVIAAVLALTQTPSALAGAAVGVWLLGLAGFPRWRRTLLIVGLLAGGGLLVVAWLGAGSMLAFRPEDLGGQQRTGFGLVSRLEIWQRALRMAHDMPYTGIGLNTFPLVMDRFYSGFSLGPEPHAHQLFLHTAADLGLPGLVALVWLLGMVGVLTVRAVRWQGDLSLRWLALGSGCGLVAYSIFGLLDTFTLGAKPGLAFWVMMGLIGAAGTSTAGQPGSLDGKSEQPFTSGPSPAGGPEADKLQTESSVFGGQPPGPHPGLRATPLPILGEGRGGTTLSPSIGGGEGRGAGTPRAVLAVHGLGVALLSIALAWPLTYAGPSLNAGRVAAHAALLSQSPEQDAQLRRALPLLEDSVEADPANSGAWYLLGSAEAGLGVPGAAVAALRRGTQVDLRAPLARYAPAEAWTRPRPQQDDPAGLLRVYGQWTARYPERAEWHLTTALLHCEVLVDRPAALQAIASGLARAHDRALLEYYRAKILEGGEC